MREMQIKQALIDEIVSRELAIFLTVPTVQGVACHDDSEQFRIVRTSQFAV